MQSPVEITAFRESDYPQALALWKSVEGLSIIEEDTPEAIASFLERNPGFSFVARDTERGVVGTVLCGHNGRAGQIYHLAIAGSHRRRGLAKTLVERCFSKLDEAMIVRCNIFVYSNNRAGGEFWMDTGWKDPSNWKVMQKRIHGP